MLINTCVFSFHYYCFILVTVVGVKHDIVVLICISLIISDAEHLFMCLVVISEFFFGRNVCSSLLLT